MRDLSKERPVDDGVFRIYRRLFDYDPLDLDTKVESVDDRSRALARGEGQLHRGLRR